MEELQIYVDEKTNEKRVATLSSVISNAGLDVYIVLVMDRITATATTTAYSHILF